MVKQGYGEQQALEAAAAEGWHWLMHIDPDELFWPGGPVFSITGKRGWSLAAGFRSSGCASQRPWLRSLPLTRPRGAV